MRLGAGGAGNGARSEGGGAVVKPRLGQQLPALRIKSGWDLSSAGLPVALEGPSSW